MSIKWFLLTVAIAIIANSQISSTMPNTVYASDSSFSNNSKSLINKKKSKNIGEILDACGVDSFWVSYFPITIHINRNECYITPPIGETTLAINSFPFVEYLAENQIGNPPFVTKKDLGEVIIYVDGGEIWISTFVKGKKDLTMIMYADTLENYAQTFSPNFEKFYKLLNTYKKNYEIQSKYYEENHKFIGE